MFGRFTFGLSKLVAATPAVLSLAPRASSSPSSLMGSTPALALRRWLSGHVARPTLLSAPLSTGGLLGSAGSLSVQAPASLVPSAVGQIFVRTVKVRTAVKKRCEECYFGKDLK